MVYHTNLKMISLIFDETNVSVNEKLDASQSEFIILLANSINSQLDKETKEGDGLDDAQQLFRVGNIGIILFSVLWGL